MITQFCSAPKKRNIAIFSTTYRPQFANLDYNLPTVGKKCYHLKNVIKCDCQLCHKFAILANLANIWWTIWQKNCYMYIQYHAILHLICSPRKSWKLLATGQPARKARRLDSSVIPLLADRDVLRRLPGQTRGTANHRTDSRRGRGFAP